MKSILSIFLIGKSLSIVTVRTCHWHCSNPYALCKSANHRSMNLIARRHCQRAHCLFNVLYVTLYKNCHAITCRFPRELGNFMKSRCIARCVMQLPWSATFVPFALINSETPFSDNIACLCSIISVYVCIRTRISDKMRQKIIDRKSKGWIKNMHVIFFQQKEENPIKILEKK